MTFCAFVFDLDGTLLDSNPLHVRAWCAAFEQFELEMTEDRIAEEIGKGGDQLVPSLIGKELDKKFGKKLGKAHDKEFEKLAARNGLKFFPDWDRLLKACHERDARLALATSSDKKQLDFIHEITSIDLWGFFDEIVTAADVDQTKPSPDLFTVAVQKLRQPRRNCVVVGDTPHDCTAALKAKLAAVGLRSGGHKTKTLQSAGAFVVYNDCTDMLRNLPTLLDPAKSKPA
ncbi:MAG TPA: HAD family phosphatase [Tepidisphaeraceae bacterium]|nr:HAD family phosphatase [Tepidisphaeraceae bacterium]